MTLIVHEWLPETAITQTRIRAAFAGALGQWSQVWLAGGREVEISDRPASIAAQDDGSFHFEAGAVAFQLPATAKRYLLEAVLGEGLSGKSLTADDHRLLDKLAGKAVQDLISRLEALIPSASIPNGKMRRLGLFMAGHECGRFTFPAHALVALVKAGMKRSSISSPPLARRLTAIAPCEVEVEADLGHVLLKVDELRDLEPGDVLVLEQSLDALVSMRLATSKALLGQGRLSPTKGRNGIALAV